METASKYKKIMYSLLTFCISYEDSLVKSIKIDIDVTKELKMTIKFRKPGFAPGRCLEAYAKSMKKV